MRGPTSTEDVRPRCARGVTSLDAPGRFHARSGLLAGGTLAAVAGALLAERIPQDPGYHRFADARTLLSVPNAMDVVSSAAFVVAGALGLVVASSSGRFLGRQERLPWLVLFAGVALTGAGSAWYHLEPTHASLAWDRLPMTLGFMGLLSAQLAERASLRWGSRLLAPLVLAGAASVGWWAWTEAHGAGDLRPYALVQLYPLAAIPLLLALYPPRYTRGADLLVAVAWYAAAKVAEVHDAEVFGALGVVSGHTLKHLLAAIGVAWLARMLALRRPAAHGAAPAPARARAG